MAITNQDIVNIKKLVEINIPGSNGNTKSVLSDIDAYSEFLGFYTFHAPNLFPKDEKLKSLLSGSINNLNNSVVKSNYKPSDDTKKRLESFIRDSYVLSQQNTNGTENPYSALDIFSRNTIQYLNTLNNTTFMLFNSENFFDEGINLLGTYSNETLKFLNGKDEKRLIASEKDIKQKCEMLNDVLIQYSNQSDSAISQDDKDEIKNTLKKYFNLSVLGVLFHYMDPINEGKANEHIKPFMKLRQYFL